MNKNYMISKNYKMDEIHFGRTLNIFQATMVEGLKIFNEDISHDDMFSLSQVNGLLSIYMNMMDTIDSIHHIAYPTPVGLFGRYHCKMISPVNLTGDSMYREDEIKWMQFMTNCIHLTLDNKHRCRKFYSRHQTEWIKDSFHKFMVETVVSYYTKYSEYDEYLADLCHEIIAKYLNRNREEE